MPIMSITGLVTFARVTTDDYGKEYESFKLFLEADAVAKLEEGVRQIRVLEKTARSPLKSLDEVNSDTGTSPRQDCRLIDVPNSYTHFINIKNAVGGYTEYLALDLSPLSLQDFKSGDEVKVQLNMFKTIYKKTGKHFASISQMKVLKLASQKYKTRFISEADEKAANEDFFKDIPKPDEVEL